MKITAEEWLRLSGVTKQFLLKKITKKSSELQLTTLKNLLNIRWSNYSIFLC
ncbi:hypothetical protein [Peribacillus loiseleuriae]|uniref:hypothetical protein n=1 Tax=Peribacillus loiseleuriae TaxID=1679170 RepID=UPI000A6618C8|nr:hypothetical protein [Peribacillus loiseleuriae]